MTKHRRITTETIQPFLDQINHFGVGFEPLFDKLATSSNSVSYPPHNLVKLDENNYVVELAVAGFAKEEVEIEKHKNVLTISGKKEEKTDEEEVYYVHKGISSRSFQRRWTLAEHIDVGHAELKDGILRVKLHRNVPEEEMPKLIDIS